MGRQPPSVDRGTLGGAATRASVGAVSVGQAGRWLAFIAGALGARQKLAVPARTSMNASHPVFPISAATTPMNNVRTNPMPRVSAV